MSSAVRICSEGTRVVILGKGVEGAGEVEAVRREPWLKRYAVRCDDGTVRFASPHERAWEDDPTRAPMGPGSEY